MGNEPQILWTPTSFKRQKHNCCVATAISSLMEKLLEQKGRKVTLNADDLDFKLRVHLHDFDKGISTEKALEYVMDYGVGIFKIGGYMTINPYKAQMVRKFLACNPLLVKIKTYESYKTRIQDGYYRIGQQQQGTHLAVIMGYTPEGFLIQDSHYDEMYKIKVDEFSVMVAQVYQLTI
jgi:hypothetical protein